jgi:hypothetical protein
MPSKSRSRRSRRNSRRRGGGLPNVNVSPASVGGRRRQSRRQSRRRRGGSLPPLSPASLSNGMDGQGLSFGKMTAGAGGPGVDMGRR